MEIEPQQIIGYYIKFLFIFKMEHKFRSAEVFLEFATPSLHNL